MASVFLDTTVLRNDPRRTSPAWKVLTKLAKRGMLEVHLSDVSKREFTTNREQEFDSAIAALNKSIRELKDFLPEGRYWEDLEAQAAKMAKRRDWITDELSEFLMSVFATVHPVVGEHALTAVDAYFTGSAPFSKIKSRDDFPDAFIYQALTALAQTVNPLHVVTGDKRFAAAIGKVPGAIAYASLKELIEAEAISGLIQRSDNIDWFIRFVGASENGSSDGTIARLIQEKLDGHAVHDFHNNYEARVIGYDEIRDIDFDQDNVEDWGEGVLVLPFTALCNCLVELYIEKWEYHGIDDSRRPKSIEDWNERIYRAEEYYDLKIVGTVTVETEPGVLDGRITKMKEWAEILKLGNVEVEIKSLSRADPELRQLF